MNPARTRIWLVCLLLTAFAPGARAQDAAPPTSRAEKPATRTHAAKKVEPGDWVWIDFALWEESGALLETTTNSQPLRLKHGEGTVPAAVEEAMLGMVIDEHKTVRMPIDPVGSEESPVRFESVALEAIPETTREVGHPIVMDDGSGTMQAGRVQKIEGDRAIIDWKPFAGQMLTFDFRIVEIYVPAEEDLSEGSGAN